MRELDTAERHPPLLVSTAIGSRAGLDREELRAALKQLASDAPACVAHLDPEIEYALVEAPDEARLDALVAGLVAQFDDRVDVGAPMVCWRETITKPVELDYRHERRLGPTTQFAQVRLRLEPAPRGAGNAFASQVEALDPAYLAGVERGVAAVADGGVYLGFPLIDVDVTLVGAVAHEVDSSPLAFEIATRAAFRAAARDAEPALLEPIMTVSVTAPEPDLAAVVADLRARGAALKRDAGGVQATARLSALLGHAKALDAMTDRRATLDMRFERYDFALKRGDDPDPPAAAARA